MSNLPAEAIDDRDAFVARLASAFGTALREELDGDTMDEVVRLNAAEASDGVCHSHDFCDANMSMLAAVREVAPDWDFDPANPDEAAIWNDAWEVAMKSGFAVEAPSALRM